MLFGSKIQLTSWVDQMMDDREIPRSYFPAHPDDHLSLSALRKFQDWNIESATSNLSEFFQSLVEVLATVLSAQLVTVWDNNDHGRCLVLQASHPKRESIQASHTVPIENSYTGLAAKKKDFVYYANLNGTTEGRSFQNPQIVRELDLASMISVPVFRPTSPQTASLVINFCFDSKHHAASPFSEEDARRLATRLGTALQYHIYKRDEQINASVQPFAATAKGAASLFDNVCSDLHLVTRCRLSGLLSWEGGNRRLKLERSAKSIDPAGEIELGLDGFNTQYQELLVSTCVQERKPLVARAKSAIEANGFESGDTVTVPFMAVPILSSSKEVLGVISCKEPQREGGRAPSFSSLDLHALETFSRAIAPSIERAVRLRKESGVMKIVAAVSHAMVQDSDLEASLQRAIGTLTELLHSEVGSIYLREGNTGVFRMRAAKGSNEKLIGQAFYKVGEGITGTVAAGEVLSFKSLAEMRKHPNYLGKYDRAIWGEESNHESETFLGIPIILGGTVIGLWKVSNISPSEEHPDPYYTDEDIQAGQVLSSLTAYAIQNRQLQDMRLRQFKLLAKTVQIQESNDVNDAILSVMIALEDAGFPGALLSLYDSQRRQIVAEQSSGRTWKGIRTTNDIDDNEIRAMVLRSNEETFVADSSTDPRCVGAAAESKTRVHAEYVLPLRLDEELIGTLQVDLGSRSEVQEEEALILKAFASHLSIAISRIRSIQEALALTNQIMSSSRFLTAETLSGMAVHSLHHRLAELTGALRKELERQEIRQNAFLLKTLGDWNSRLLDLELELKKILNFVRAASQGQDVIDIHPEVQVCINTWFRYMRNQHCSARPILEARKSHCRIEGEAFREILSILLVNAVQAHAKQIDIKTSNEVDIRITSDIKIKSAFCLVCSDDGIGLATNNAEEIFEATYTTKASNLGTGLGLFVARRLARNAGGDLDVVSSRNRNKGVVFRLTLPLAEEQSHDK